MSLKDSIRPGRWIVVRAINPHFSFLGQVSLDEPIWQTIVPSTVLLEQQSTLLETLFVMFTNFSLSVSQRTPMTDLRAFDGPSCTIVSTIRTLASDDIQKFH